MEEEETEEVMLADPGHVRRWVQQFEDLAVVQGSSFPKLLAPHHSTTAGEILENASGDARVHSLNPSTTKGITSISSVDADVRPSTAGVMATSMQVGRGEVDGSDLDSEFDDVFDVALIETTVEMTGGG